LEEEVKESFEDEDISDFDTIVITFTKKPGNDEQITVTYFNVVICNKPGK
jgi:hypothetical protein